MSVSATFAADEDIALGEVNDEIAVDDNVLSVEEDTDTLSVADEPAVEADDTSDVVGSSSTVTNTTFHDYFDEYGSLTSDADELIFEGNFTGIDVSVITIANDKPVKFTGKNATFNNVQFLIMQSNVTISGFNFIYNDGDGKLINIIGVDALDNITISNNKIDFTAVKDYDSYAIFAGYESALDSRAITNLTLLNNIFTYVGNTNGSTINNVIRIVGYPGYYDLDTDDEISPQASSDILIEENIFDIQIPSVPRYSTDRPDTNFATGMEFIYCSNLNIKNNRIGVRYTSSNGDFNTIDIIDVKGDPYNLDFLGEIVCKNITISNNTIDALGHSYIYAISASAEGVEINDNNINITADDYQAGGIYVEVPSTSVIVKNNNIALNAKSVTYGIYSYEYQGAPGPVKELTIVNNTVYGNAYASCGLEIRGRNISVSDNEIYSYGNYTYGIALGTIADGTTIENNAIYSYGNNIGVTDTGDGFIPKGNSKAISISGDVIVKNNEIFSTDIGINAIIDGKMIFDNNTIVVMANNGKVDTYAIVANDITDLNITNNNVTYYGLVDYQFNQTGVDEWGYPVYDTSNNTHAYGVYIKNSNVTIENNTFDINIPTFAVNWGMTREAFSEGIVLVGCDDMTFKGNNVVVTANDGSSYDTIYGIDVINSANANVEGNNLTLNGKGYSYGIIINDVFTISKNNITVLSDNYACGIEVEGSGMVSNNTVAAIATTYAYPIYSGMDYAGVLAVDYVDNQVYGNAYFVVGASLGVGKENVINNTIIAEGNYTVGIGSNSNNNTISGNIIRALGNGVGNQTSGDYYYPIQNTGIVILKADANITDNYVEATNGDCAVNLTGTNSTVDDNYLVANNTVGAKAIADAGSGANISNLSPEFSTVLVAENVNWVYKDGSVYSVKALDENGNPIKNITIIAVNGLEYSNATTNDKGIAEFAFDLNAGEYEITFTFYGNETYGPKTTVGKITVAKKPTAFTAPNTSLLVTATKSGSDYKIVLKDNSGNVLAKQNVVITFNGKTSNAVTDANGAITYKLVAAKEGSYQLSLSFAGNDNYAASTATATVKVTKEATKLTAKKKTFKAKVKTKKYTVTLKDSKGKAIKKVKVTLKVKGKTYKATTNAKGKVTFKIKNLKKKGKYTATVKFAGNNLYKAATKKVKITVKK